MVNKFQRTSLAIGVSLALAGCGGGGGGGGGLSSTLAPFTANSVPFHAPVRINSFQPHHQPHEYRTPLTEIHTQDLNGDGADEVLWSNVAFDWTGNNWINSQVQIFGFNTGSFANETTSWFAPGDNIYVGGFKINFGDFNQSGYTDVFLAAFTDTLNYHGDSVLLENTVTMVGGVSQFQRRNIDFGINIHSHDSVVADFNNDGIADVLTTGSGLVLGSNTGNYVTYVTPACCAAGSVVGSGISAADYLGDGTMTVIITDGTTELGNNSDTVLLRPRIENGQLVMDHVARLPADRFFLPKWDSLRASTPLSPHAVRNITMDFDSDGRPDVVVFSTMPLQNMSGSHGFTEVQFLRNDGGGVFIDVTDSVLVGFDHGKTVSYNPQLMDVNNDGLLDIFMSATDYTGQSSTSVLLATREGRFVESYTHVFDAFASQMQTSLGNNAGTVQPIAIVAGPNNTRYFVSGVEYFSNGTSRVAVYASLVGSTGTVTPQATIDTVRQIWPWLSDAEVNTLLSQSSTTWLNGIPVIDLNNVMSPLGGLGISVGGQTPARVPIHGSISIPGMDRKLLSNITAVDMLGRDFRVDLGSMQQSLKPLSMSLIDNPEPSQSWSSNLVPVPQQTMQGFKAAGDNNNWTTGATLRPFGPDRDWTLNLTATRTPGSPWLGFSGMFGQVNSSMIIETSMTRTWGSGHWVQLGGMQTSTDFTPGLVRDVGNIYSVFATAGWQDQNWKLFGGLQPHIVQGRVTLDLPTSVDNQGRLHYTSHTVNMRNPAVTFMGVRYQKSHNNHNWMVGGIIDSQQRHQVKFEYKHTFQ